MAAQAEHAPVTPAVLTWARERAGCSVEDVAARLGIKPERVAKWEAGHVPLTFGRVDALAKLFHRPSAVFYMPHPPEERVTEPKDFRASGKGEPDTPGLRYQVRLANERRRIALDLVEGLQEPLRRFDFRTTLDDDQEEAGSRLRRLFGLPEPSDPSRSRPPAPYSRWRDAVETRGVLVFQAPFRELEEVRGFSIYERELPIVVVRTDASTAGRLFTLMHELAHLGLREGGICDLEDRGVEGFCNRVAAAALMPADTVRLLARNRSGSDWTRTLARKLHVSEEAFVLRLVHLRLVPREMYQRCRAEFAARKGGSDEERSGGPPPHVTALARTGNTYARWVVHALSSGRISIRSAALYLGVGHQQIDKIVQTLAERAWKRESAA